MIPLQQKALIIDDDADAIANLQKLLVEQREIRVAATVNDPTEAVEAVKAHRPDLIFLDVQMPGKDGFEVLRDLLAEGLQPEVIFVTAYDRYAIDAIRFSAIDYLLKPVSPFDLQNALIRFMGKAAGARSDAAIQTLLEKTLNHSGKLKFSTHSGFFVISPEDIIYIQADWNYSEIFLAGGKQELVTINIGKLEDMLSDKSFCRISRSVISNTDYLVLVNRRKRTVELSHNGNEYSFKVPLLNIRRIEHFIDREK